MSLNSFSETSAGTSFLKPGLRHPLIDSKELSLLDDLELTPVHGIVSEVFQVENPSHFTENDWQVQDLDLLNDGPASNPSESRVEPSSESNLFEDSHHRTLNDGSPCEFEINVLSWEEDYDFFQEGEELLDMVDTSIDSKEDELASFFSFLKTDGNNHRHQDVSQKTAIGGSSAPSCTDRPYSSSNHGAVKERYLMNRNRWRRLRLLEKSSSGCLFDDLECDESLFKVKGSLFIKEDTSDDAVVHHQKSSYRVVCHHKKRSRRFPVDRSSLLRSVLTKNVTFSVL